MDAYGAFLGDGGLSESVSGKTLFNDMLADSRSGIIDLMLFNDSLINICDDSLINVLV